MTDESREALLEREWLETRDELEKVSNKLTVCQAELDEARKLTYANACLANEAIDKAARYRAENARLREAMKEILSKKSLAAPSLWRIAEAALASPDTGESR